MIILHNIRSLHNVGSIFRTADGAGFNKVYLCGITPEPVDRFGHLRPEFSKVALGAEKSVAWEKVKSVTALIERLKKNGWTICAVEQDSRAVGYKDWKKIAKAFPNIVLVMGGEVAGLPESVLSRADYILEIPMRGSKESLNVAVAFGIAAYGIALSADTGRRTTKRYNKREPRV